MATSIARRKPVYTFKSPPTQGVVAAPAPELAPPSLAILSKEPTPVPPSRSTTASSTPTPDAYTSRPAQYAVSSKHKPAAPLLINPKLRLPALPLYHPLGKLACSLPALDPALFGLPSTVAVDDERETDDARRASSRSRRPAAKVRERDEAQAQAQEEQPAAAEDAKAASPRKRRAGGGGAKRKRRDVDDGEGLYAGPPPAKRTRNPRGAVTPSVGSPLVMATAAADIEETPEESTPAAQEESAAPVKNTRSRRSRAAAGGVKRRNSSASDATATSVSASIVAANTRSTRSSAKAEAAVNGQQPEPGLKTPPEAEDTVEKPGDEKEAEKTEEPQAQETTSPLPVPQDTPENDAMSTDEPQLPEAQSEAQPAPKAEEPSPKASEQPEEEKEEGELSDDQTPAA